MECHCKGNCSLWEEKVQLQPLHSGEGSWFEYLLELMFPTELNLNLYIQPIIRDAGEMVGSIYSSREYIPCIIFTRIRLD